VSSVHGSPPDDLLSEAGSVNIETVLPPNASPLAQLLATATADKKEAISSIVFPLAAAQRIKRKPLRFRPKGESRFRPKSVKKEESIIIGKPAAFLGQKAASIKSRFSGFSKRPRPSPVKQIIIKQDNASEEEEVVIPIDTTTTTQATLQLEDFFGTPEPVGVTIDRVSEESPIFSTKSSHPIPFSITKSLNPIPLVLSNDISSGSLYDQTALFERLQSITGAQPVGVTRDIAQHRPVEQTGVSRREHSRQEQGRQEQGRQEEDRQENARQEQGRLELGTQEHGRQDHGRQEHGRQLVEQAGRGRSGGRRGALRRVAQEQRAQEQTYESRQETNIIPVAPARLPRRKKSSFAPKKRNKVKVGTVDRYRHENEDGSITWGYENDDGGFKEETIGIDCITHGKYGYTDPSGEIREYSYTSGIRCDPDTRKVTASDPGLTGARGPNGHGFFDYSQNKFVMPDGRRVTVVVNQGNKARGRRY